ncbi:hypothetical protein DYB25_011262 [Aphanomyces astaci]|uniref:Casein kinase II subunit beta n=1 Tax=Aphanomyces astaci TaxID=112090 RepID=A0A397DNS4_APHAT|nr:hypothetical protein DYB25_011262 [Aphanomyces astaci]RHY50435.1 hypothetical protein DYB34_010451 [Aphanomyces astaci]RHY68541.1 hypothetical protein DYB38_007439 [Aphanomyces astaci]
MESNAESSIVPDLSSLSLADAVHVEDSINDTPRALDENDMLGAEADLSEDESSDDVASEESEEEEEEEEEEELSWIAWFCSLRGNEFFCEIDEDYIVDDFNLTGLNGIVPYYDYAMDMILDVETAHDDALTDVQQELVESAAEMLYGLIHARYILTSKGMAAMLEKYHNVDFGRCHRVYCQGQPVLPVGQSDIPRHTTVNIFCPRCRDIFFPKSQRQGNIDGAYFGTTFPHLFLMTHLTLVPSPPAQVYVPRVFGYKVHKSSAYYVGKKDAHESNGHRRGRRKLMQTTDKQP